MHLRVLAEPGAHLAVPQPHQSSPTRRRRSAARRPARSSCRPARPTVGAVRKSTPLSRKACTGGVILPPALVVSSSLTDFCAKSGFCSEPDRLNSGPMVCMSSRNQECDRPVARMCRSAPSASNPGNSGVGSRWPNASSHSGLGPDRIRMPCAGPHRRVVDDALRVVPHPVGVDHPAAGPLGDAEHQAVGRIRAPRRASRPARRPARPASSAAPGRGCRRCRRRSTITAAQPQA